MLLIRLFGRNDAEGMRTLGSVTDVLPAMLAWLALECCIRSWAVPTSNYFIKITVLYLSSFSFASNPFIPGPTWQNPRQNHFRSQTFDAIGS
jgi:hypothetical protein